MSKVVNSIVKPRENNDISRVHIGPNRRIFQNLEITGTPDSNAALTVVGNHGPPGSTQFENIQFEGFRGPNATITVNRAAFQGTELQMNGGEVGIKLTGGALADLQDSLITNHRRAGIRAENASILLDNMKISNNRMGLDLGEGTRGDIINSELDGNHEFDVRIDQDVLAGVFDSTATNIYNIPFNPGKLQYIDAEWISNRILDTTDVHRKARWVVKLRDKVGWKAVQTGIWELAKAIILS
jgi:hypothetical protein